MFFNLFGLREIGIESLIWITSLEYHSSLLLFFSLWYFYLWQIYLWDIILLIWLVNSVLSLNITGIVGMKVLNPYGPCLVASHPRFLNAITVVALEGLNLGYEIMFLQFFIFVSLLQSFNLICSTMYVPIYLKSDLPLKPLVYVWIWSFQILPQLLYYFGVKNGVDSLDWATIVVYTCEMLYTCIIITHPSKILKWVSF